MCIDQTLHHSAGHVNRELPFHSNNPNKLPNSQIKENVQNFATVCKYKLACRLLSPLADSSVNNVLLLQSAPYVYHKHGRSVLNIGSVVKMFCR